MSDTLVLDGIEKVFSRGKPAEVVVVRGATLAVARGEVVALVAPSGAGKSTLLHIAGLLDTPDAGRVVLEGRAMGGLGDKARTEARRGQVGFIYQFHHLLPEFSALENIVIPQRANGVAVVQEVVRSSYPGYWFDPLSMQQYDGARNWAQLGAAFDQLLQALPARTDPSTGLAA